MNDNILARFDRLNWSPYLIKLICLLGLGLFFEYYDIFIVGYIAPSLLKSNIFNTSVHDFIGLNDIAKFVSAMFLGMWCGTLVFGHLSDKYGRKSIFTWSLICYSLGTFIMAFQTTKLGFNFWRFFASIGIGIEMVTITTYLSELIPSQYRGRASAIAMTIAFLAVPVVALISWLLSTYSYFGIEGFRFVIAIGSIGAFAVWFIRLGLPESPRWLYNHGKYDQAIAIIKLLESKTHTVHTTLIAKIDVPTNDKPNTYSDIFKPPLICSSFIVAFIIHSYNVITLFTFIAACMLIVAFVVLFYGNNTNNIQLESIN